MNRLAIDIALFPLMYPTMYGTACFGGMLMHRCNMILFQVSLYYLALLLTRQLVQHLAKMFAYRPKYHLLALFRNKHYVIFAIPFRVTKTLVFFHLSVTSVDSLLAELNLTAQKPLQRAYQRDPEAIERWQRDTFPAIAKQSKAEGAEIYFWDESGFRADAVHGKTWAERGNMPAVNRPGQRQSISAASAVNAKGAFWFATYQGGLTGELFVELLKQLMDRRKKPLHLVVDGLPAHKKALVKEYVSSTGGCLTLHFLPDYAPDLNPDELVWSHANQCWCVRFLSILL